MVHESETCLLLLGFIKPNYKSFSFLNHAMEFEWWQCSITLCIIFSEMSAGNGPGEIENGSQGLSVVHVTIPNQPIQVQSVIQSNQPSVIHTAGGTGSVQTIQVVRVRTHWYIVISMLLTMQQGHKGYLWKWQLLLKPILNWANVCSQNILRTVRWTMIRFLIELLVRRTWFGQSRLYFVLNWLVMRCKLRPELAADAQQTTWSKM